MGTLGKRFIYICFSELQGNFTRIPPLINSFIESSLLRNKHKRVSYYARVISWKTYEVKNFYVHDCNLEVFANAGYVSSTDASSLFKWKVKCSGKIQYFSLTVQTCYCTDPKNILRGQTR
jgi:hypothetical protein